MVVIDTVIVTGYMMFVTSQYDSIFTFPRQRFGEVCWHSMHVILHALSLLVVVQCVIVVNISALQIRRPELNTALNAKTEQFITANISGNVLKHGSGKHSVVRQRISSWPATAKISGAVRMKP